MPKFVEGAVLFGVVGTLAAVAVPAFARNLAASKLSEPKSGLQRIAAGAVRHANEHASPYRFPPSAPLSPASVPRGRNATDPPETWEHLTWRSLGFRLDEPHAFAFRFDAAPATSSGIESCRIAAHGDLDGDGLVSTFEIAVMARPGAGAERVPGMFVSREVE